MVSLAIAALVAGAGFDRSTSALTINPDVQIGFDLGTEVTDLPGNDWNDFTTAGTKNTIHNLNGDVVPGLSASLAGGINTTDGNEDWIGLSSNGGSAPEAFVASVMTDAYWLSTTLTINGLDPAQTYDLYAVTLAFGDNFDSRQDVVTVTGASASSSSLFRGQVRTTGVFHTFLDVAPNASGTIAVATSGASGQPVLNGVLIDQVPEPGSLAALALGGLLLARRRRGGAR